MKYTSNWSRKTVAIVDLEAQNQATSTSSTKSLSQQVISLGAQSIGSSPSKAASSKTSSRQLLKQEQQPFASQDTQRVCRFRCLVLVVWLAAACIVSYGVYWYTLNAQQKEFDTNFNTNAHKLMDAVQANMHQKLNGLATLANAVTLYARYSNSTFPFVTLPDFPVTANTARILTDAMAIRWLPLVTQENREAWEAYAYQHRYHINEAFEQDSQLLTQQEEQLGYTTEEELDPHHGRRQTISGDDSTATNSTTSFNETSSLPLIINNTVQDGTKYHYKLWYRNPKTGQEVVVPSSTMAYLPNWQRSPVNAQRQSMLNIDMGQLPVFKGVADYYLKKNSTEAGAIWTPTPPPPKAYKKAAQENFELSQFRHSSEDAAHYLQGTQNTLIHPVYDGFGESRKFVGIINSNVFWRMYFTNVLSSEDATQGVLVVLTNTLNQTITYRVDGPSVEFLGMGSSLESAFNGTSFSMSEILFEKGLSQVLGGSHGAHHHRSPAETHAYTTAPLDSDFIQYTITVLPTQETADVYQTNQPTIYTSIVATIFGIAAIAFLLYDHFVRQRQHTMMQTAIEQARKAEGAERGLNEYIAHEVRNPLSAALSACSFVRSAVHEAKPLSDETSIQSVRDDVDIVGSSLKFINDLLRNMLDLHRAAAHQLKVHTVVTDIFKDVFEPVAAMLYRRDDNYELILSCPPGLMIQTDALRLKQVMLNLSRNSAKFVKKGFVKLHANVLEDDGRQRVRIYVEDSGPGISAEKRRSLFNKFQESLDLMSQGTGIGLCLCKHLVDIMGGDIWLDETYTSGIEDMPGSRFVIDLHAEPLAPLMEGEPNRTLRLSGKSHHEDGEVLDSQAVKNASNPEPFTFSTPVAPPQTTPTAEASTSGSLSSSEPSDTQPVSYFSLDICATSVHPSLDASAPMFPDGPAKDPLWPANDNHKEQELRLQEPAMPSVEKKIALKAQLNTIGRSMEEPPSQVHEAIGPKLPEELSVLFVDDDTVQRKLFGRSIKRVFPGWQVQEAASGEAALQKVLANEQPFDLIFMDQYMPATEKQLLGTETTRELRSMGVTCKICGLSANDIQEAFLNAGADAFLFKPMPVKEEDLLTTLGHILYGRNAKDQ